MSQLILSPSGSNPIAHDLSAEVVTIGRAPENTIHIEDPSVSGRHAQLHLVGETFHLQDLDSTNGTRVNGEAVTSVALRPGDRIQFGKIDACFECEASQGTPSATASSPSLSAVDARPAELSALPADFANASPFQKRTATRDPVRATLFAIAALAIVAFVASLLALAQMQPPAIP